MRQSTKWSMDEKETGRLEAFSDGVFAVAITLLVLNLMAMIPETGLLPSQLPDDADLWGKLASELPLLFAYAISFFTIGIMWLNHHRLFQHIKHTDSGLMLSNLLLLAIIVFIPVPTALLSEYLTRLHQHTAAVIYTGTCFVMSCCFNLVWHYASYHKRLLGKNVDVHQVAAISRQYFFGPVLYLITVGLAWINTPATALCCCIIALFFAFPGHCLPLVSGASSFASSRVDQAGPGEETVVNDPKGGSSHGIRTELQAS
jgi:uncharacterized membrane protein